MTRCLTPGCSRLIPSGSYCREHRPTYGTAEWKRIVAAVLLRDGHRCVLCGRPCPHPRHLEVDHAKPRGNGGTDAMSNLRTVCTGFNRGGQRCG